MLSRNIDRIQAESEFRLATLMIQTQSGEGVKALFEGLRKRMGEIAKIDEARQAMEEKYDRAANLRMKMMSKRLVIAG